MPKTRVLLPVVIAVGLGLASTTLPATASSARAPVFKTVKLADSSGRSEPRITVAPNGMKYVVTNAGRSGNETIYRSKDGIHWTETVAQPSDQTLPTTDVDIVAMRTGRILTSELDYGGINFRTQYTDDGGKTWTESVGNTLADTDRQWYAVGPNDPQTHKPRVYLLFHNLLSGVAQHNMWVATSTDGGATFGPPVPVSIPGQQDYLDLQCADSGGPSNIMVDQRTGRVYVVFGTRSSPVGGCGGQPAEVNVVAANRVWVVSADAAKTGIPGGWTPHLAVNDTGPPAHIVGMQLAPGAIDTAGNVYVAYPESVHDYPNYNGASIKVVHASPKALDKWSKPSVVASSGGVGNVLPHIIAGSPGKVDLAWYHGTKVDGKIRWYSYAAQSLDVLSNRPHWTTIKLSDVVVEPNQTSSELMGACMQGQQATLNGFVCGRSTELNGIALDKCGRLLVTFPAQADLPTDATYVSQQTSGPTVLPCASTGGSGGTVRDTTHDRQPNAAGGGPALASTGGSRLPAIGAVLLVVAAVALAVVRRRLGY